MKTKGRFFEFQFSSFQFLVSNFCFPICLIL